MKIKAILRFPLTPVRMTKITKQLRTNSGKVVGMGKIHTLSMDCKLVQPLGKSVCIILKSIKINLNCDLGIPLFGICPKSQQLIPQTLVQQCSLLLYLQ